MTSPRQIPRRLPLLDGLRGIAAMTVVLYHLGNVFHFRGPFSRGYLFVDFFFLLSGFVLTLSAERRMNSGMGLAGFMWARIKRLWPMIAIGATLGAVTATVTSDFDGVPLALTLALLMMPMLVGPGEIFPLNGPQWSLLFEIIANFFHGLILRRLRDDMVLASAVAGGIVLVLVTLSQGSNTTGPRVFNWWYGLPRVAFAYALGIWMGRKWRDGDRHLPRLAWIAALCLPGIAVIGLPALPISRAIGDLLMTVAVMPALFWLAAACDASRKAEPWLGGLGALSYPLYAVHLPILNLFATFGQSRLFQVCAVVTSLAAAQALSIIAGHGKATLSQRWRRAPA